MRAFLLAAGLGTRMGEITRRTPKCLLPVAGRPLLGHWLDRLAEAGVSAVLVNTHYLADQVQGFLAEASRPLEVEVFHEAELLGSGGTLARNRGFVPRGEPLERYS